LFVQRELHAILSPEIDLQRVPLVTARLGKVRISTLWAKTKKFSHLISII